MVEVLEDHQVERLELLLEDLLRGEGNERELVLRAVRIVSGRPEDEEADQVHVRVLLQELPEEAHVPRGPADHQQDAHAVANHLEDERARVVLRDGLALVDRSADGERELAGAVGNERQLDLVPRAAAVDVHRLLSDHLALAAQHDRHVGGSETARGDHDVDRHLVAHEGEVVDGDPFHRQILQRLRPDREREDRNVQPAQLRACGLRDALGQLRVVRPVAGNEQTRERPASAAPRGRRDQTPENVGRRALRIGRKPARVGGLQLLVESVDVHLEPGTELRQVRLVLRGPAPQLLGTRRTRGRSGKLHRSAGVEEERDARADAALRAQLDARLEKQDEHEQRRRQPEGEERNAPVAGRLAAKAAERQPDSAGQRDHRQGEEPARQRGERRDAPGVVGGVRDQILRRFMMNGMCTWSSL